MKLYFIIMAVMAVLAVVVFICLFRFKAGYGFLRAGGWGPQISNKAAWVLMEAPAFLLMFWWTLHFAKGATVIIMAALFLLHYFQRSFIFPLLMRGHSKMPVAIMFMGMLFNSINAYLIAGWLFKLGSYVDSWLTSPQFIIGTVIFFAGMAINLHSDHVIRHLRKPGDTKHYIPRKGFYKYVTSANYFGEFVEWVGYAILTWSPAGLLFAVWTFANLAPRSKSLTEKYIQEFGEEYSSLGRKNMIPFIW